MAVLENRFFKLNFHPIQCLAFSHHLENTHQCTPNGFEDINNRRDLPNLQQVVPSCAKSMYNHE
jgi:hypothetical protein